MSKDWGPWIEHDGRGFPVPVGTVVCRVFDDYVDRIDGKPCEPTREIVCLLQEDELPSWLWCLPRSNRIGTIPRVIRYRIRKPRALQQLRELVENLPAPQRQPDREDA